MAVSLFTLCCCGLLHVLHALETGFLAPLLVYLYLEVESDIGSSNAGLLYATVVATTSLAELAGATWGVGAASSLCGRHGPRVVILGALLCTTLGAVSTAFADSVLALVGARAASGVGYGAAVGVSSALLSGVVTRGKREFLGGAGLIASIALLVGMLAGGWAGEKSVHAQGVQPAVKYTMLASGVASIGLFFAVLVHFVPPRTFPSIGTPDDKAAVASGTSGYLSLSRESTSASLLYNSIQLSGNSPGDGAVPPHASFARGLLISWRTLPTPLLYSGMAAAYALAVSFWEVAVPLFASRALGLSSGWLGCILSTSVMAAILSDVSVFLRLVQWFPLKMLPVAGMLLIAIGLAIAPITSSLPAFVVLIVLASLGHGILARPSLTVIDHAQAGWVDDPMGVQIRRRVQALFRTLGVLVAGIVYDVSLPFLASSSATKTTESELEQTHALTFWIGSGCALVAGLFALSLPLDAPFFIDAQDEDEDEIVSNSRPFQVPVQWAALAASEGVHVDTS